MYVADRTHKIARVSSCVPSLPAAPLRLSVSLSLCHDWPNLPIIFAGFNNLILFCQNFCVCACVCVCVASYFAWLIQFAWHYVYENTAQSAKAKAAQFGRKCERKKKGRGSAKQSKVGQNEKKRAAFLAGDRHTHTHKNNEIHTHRNIEIHTQSQLHTLA